MKYSKIPGDARPRCMCDGADIAFIAVRQVASYLTSHLFKDPIFIPISNLCPVTHHGLSHGHHLSHQNVFWIIQHCSFFRIGGILCPYINMLRCAILLEPILY